MYLENDKATTFYQKLMEVQYFEVGYTIYHITAGITSKSLI
jgi:hypothetical protein